MSILSQNGNSARIISSLICTGVSLICGITTSSGQNLDSLYQVVDRLPKDDTLRIRTIFQICYYEHTAHPEKSRKLAEESLVLSRSIGYVFGEGYSHRYIALYHWMNGNYEKAMEHGLEMLRVFEEEKHDRGITQSYSLLGLIHEEWGDFIKSKEYFLKSVEMNRRSGRDYDLGYSYNSLGALHHKFARYDEAESYYLQSLEIRKKQNDQDAISQSYSNLAQIAKEKEEYEKALQYMESALEVSFRINNVSRMSILNLGLGDTYIRLKKYNQAALYLSQSLEQAIELRSKKRIRAAYNKLAELEEARNNFKKALEYHSLEYQYQDSLFTEEKTIQIAEMEAKYDSEKQQQEILMLSKDKKIERLWKNFLGITLVIAILAGVTFIRFLKVRERKNIEILNLKLDRLMDRHSDLATRYRDRIITTNYEKATSAADKLVEQAMEVVMDQMKNPLFGVDQMAKEMGMSRATLHRRLKSRIGIAPSDFIRSMRLKKAAYLLSEKTDNISQVGYAVGFEDQSYFSKCFKKQFGVAPSNYGNSSPAEAETPS